MTNSEAFDRARTEFSQGKATEEIFTSLRAAVIANSKTPLNFGTFPDPHANERRWIAFSTALAEGWIMLHCTFTGAQGVIKDPSTDEWARAFDAPSSPYHWSDNVRVTLMQEGAR